MAHKQTGRAALNDGKDSEDIFETGMKKHGCAVFRLRDKRDLHGLNKHSVAVFGQPSDFVVIASRGAFLVEVKSTQEKTSFPFSCFTKAQASAMAQCVSCKVGHNYLIYIHNLNANEWYSTTADQVIATYKENRKSLRWDEIQYIGEI